MTFDVFLALVLFVALMVGTPGPANILAMAAGASWGVRVCLPFVFGLTCGKLFVNLCVALGLLALISAEPLAMEVLRIISGAYLLWLAWRIAGMRLRGGHRADAEKPGFLAGLIVHPLNPKAWAMVIAAYAQFAEPEGSWLLQSVVITLTFFAVQSMMHPLWCYGGMRLAKALGGTVWERRLMLALALSLLLLVLWAVFGA